MQLARRLDIRGVNTGAPHEIVKRVVIPALT
jgi:hypothetical protein